MIQIQRLACLGRTFLLLAVWLTGTPLSIPSADAANDRFGINELYPTVTGGIVWESTWDSGIARTFTWGQDPQDSWFRGKGNATYKVDGNGLFMITGPVPRMYIHDPTLTRSWRNVEMTVYAMRKSDSGTAYAGIVGIARANHGLTGSETQDLCDTRGMGARMRLDGHIDFEKETSHPNSVPTLNKTIWPGGLPYNIWIGYKYVVYDLPNGNVKAELWMDQTDGLNGGTWVMINELEDNGSNFGAGGTPCQSGISPTLKLLGTGLRQGSESGKPNAAVYFRSDNIGTDGLVYKNMSVREIASPESQPPPDTTPPVISAAAATSIGQTAATIVWTTDEPADTQLEYGQWTGYGTWSPLNETLATAHSVVLTGLNPGTQYYFGARSRDAAGNLASAGPVGFTTASAVDPSCKSTSGTWQSTLLAGQTGTFTATFSAVPGASGMDGVTGLSNGAANDFTDLAAIARFNTAGFIDARNGASYAAQISVPYTAGVTYFFRLVVNVTAHIYSIYVRPAGGTEQLLGSNYAFRTEQQAVTSLNMVNVYADGATCQMCQPTFSAADSTPPVVSGSSVTAIAQNTANAVWTTNEAADSQVEYGLTTGYGSTTPVDSALLTAHTVALSGLTSGTKYYYRVKSRDAAGNLTTAGASSFTTATAQSAACSSTGRTWKWYPIPTQTGTFTAEFDATPNTANQDSAVGFSKGKVKAYAKMAPIVRFNTAGRIDARNGSVYAAQAIVPYSAGTTYRFRLVINVATRRYTVYVRSGSNPEQLLGSNYAFRTEQASVTSLDNLTFYAQSGNLTACQATVTP